jgi:hypothetical protein
MTTTPEVLPCKRRGSNSSVRAVEDCTAIRLSAANLYKVYEQDLKQFALIQMNMGREVTRRLREADNQLFRATMGPDPDIEHVFPPGAGLLPRWSA